MSNPSEPRHSKENSSIASFERKLYVFFSLIIIVLATVFWLLFSNYNKMKGSAQWVEHTWQVLNESEKLKQEYSDMMAKSRGFVITGINGYNQGFIKDTISICGSLQNLSKLTADNRIQQKHLSNLGQVLIKRIKFSEQTIQLRRLKGFEEARQIIAQGEGEKLSAEIDSIIKSIQSVEQVLLAERIESNQTNSQQVFFVIWLLMAVLFFILIAVLYIIVTTLRLRSKMADDLRENELATETLRGQQRYREALDNMLEGIQIIDKDWKYVYVNHALAKQGKYPAEQLIGHTMMEMYPGIENTELFTTLKRSMNERKAFLLENKFIFPDGSTGYFELSLQPVPEGVFILSIDISERKKAEHEIRKLNEDLEKKVAERTEQLNLVNEELESFSYSVSHDLRAPLRAVSGYSGILSEDYSDKLDKEGHRIIKVIQDSVKQMGQLITDLLTFARMGKDDLNKQLLDMSSLVNSVAEEQKVLNPERNIIFNIKQLEAVTADESMMKQVITNLLSNAVKYTSKKEKAEIEIGSYKNESEITYYIKDNGAGFDMEYQEKLFGVFQRLHAPSDFKGTGIGLALVKRIIARHHGKVWAEGKVNEGACFYFSLPLQA